jgi:putative salt-induced outer membrane protein YdiY
MKVFLVVIVLTSLPASADVIIMKNGDRITGEIKEIWDSEVSIEPEYSDEFDVDIKDIASIDSDNKFDVELEDGQIGEFQFAGINDEGEAILTGQEGEMTVSLAQLKKVGEIEDWFEWDSYADVSQSFSRGNTDSDASNLNATLKMKWGDHRTIFTLTDIREAQAGKTTKKTDRLNLSYNFLFSKPWFLAANATVERNPVALLERRFSFNPAIGYDIWDDPDLSLNIQLGAGYQTEEIDNVTESGTLIDWRLRYEQDIFTGDLQLFHSHQLYQNLEGRENLVFISQTGVRYEITDDIYLNTQINYDYDSEPAQGTDGEDLTFLFGAGIEF